MTRLLLVHRSGEAFAARDAELLGDAYDVERVDGIDLRGIARAAVASWRAGAVLCWFVSVHSVVPILVGRLRRKPVVVIPGGYEVVSLPEHGYGWQGQPVRRAIVKWALRSATAVVAVSPTMVERIRDATGVEAVLVPNAVEPMPALPASERRYDVVTASITVDEDARRNKGTDVLYALAARCPDLSFLMVGPDPSAPTQPNLRVTGLVPPAEAADLIARSRAYLQATRGFEAFGVAVLEAMARGVTPVVTATGSLPWVVGDTGEVVAVDDLAGFEAAIRRAVAGGDGAAAQARVREAFSPSQRRVGLLRAIEGAAPAIP